MPKTTEDLWRQIVSGESLILRTRRAFKIIPAADRCKNCNAPFTGFGGALMLLTGRHRYRRNPRFCNF